MRATLAVLLLTLAPALPAQEGEELAEAIGMERAKMGDPDVYATVNFKLGSADLTDNAKAVLDRVVRDILGRPGRVEIIGHTDSSGEEAVNSTLSDLRAKAVLQYLVQRGFSAEQLAAIGMGARDPVDSNDTGIGRALNRRADLKLRD